MWLEFEPSNDDVIVQIIHHNTIGTTPVCRPNKMNSNSGWGHLHFPLR